MSEACSNCPNCTCNKSGLDDIHSNVTLSDFFGDIVMAPSSPRKDKPECFGCSG